MTIRLRSPPPSDGTTPAKKAVMKTPKRPDGQLPGKLGWILLWLIGIPIPVLLILFLLRGCT